jgi:transcriptional regulator with XRE-family HTH domain
MRLTIREVAVTLEVTAETHRGWEHGAHEPSFRQYPAIFGFLGYDPLPEPRNLRDQLRRARMRRGWRQSDLAEALGVDPCTVAGWEAGAHGPTRKWRTAIERLVGTVSLAAERKGIRQGPGASAAPSR